MPFVAARFKIDAFVVSSSDSQECVYLRFVGWIANHQRELGYPHILK
jgi:hypothetical protein